MEAGRKAPVQGILFEDTSVTVDGCTFVECSFVNVALVFAGGIEPIFERCRFEGIQLQFEGAAATAIAGLAGMSRSGLAYPVKKVTGAIRSRQL